MLEYQIPTLQKQLQIVKDLKSLYEDVHSSFAAKVPEKAPISDKKASGPVQRDEMSHVRHDGGAPASSALSQQSGAQVSETQAQLADSSNLSAHSNLLNAFKRQVHDLDRTASMEQTAAFVLATELDRHDALAVITGKKARYYVNQTTVSVGRTSVYKGRVCFFHILCAEPLKRSFVTGVACRLT